MTNNEYHVPYGNLLPHKVGDNLGREIVLAVEPATVWDGDEIVPGTIVTAAVPVRVACIEITSPLGVLWQVSRTCHKTGQVRERLFPNLSEAVEEWETPLGAAVRGLKEELGLEVKASDLTPVSTSSEVKPSPTTGEMKAYVFTRFALEISNATASSLPLEADEGDCTIAFEWRH